MTAATIILTIAAPAAAQRSHEEFRRDRMQHEIFHELLTLPYYGIFDNLGFEIGQKGTVTLVGQVSRPSLKNDAERAAKSVEGVEQVINKIEVLPTSPNDDRLRLALYRAIYRHDSLERYGLGANPPIHIIVKNGHVTLEGSVSSQMDKQLAEMQARGVAGTFSIKNNLRIEK
jgi:hyperosmotically inducible protein